MLGVVLFNMKSAEKNLCLHRSCSAEGITKRKQLLIIKDSMIGDKYNSSELNYNYNSPYYHLGSTKLENSHVPQL